MFVVFISCRLLSFCICHYQYHYWNLKVILVTFHIIWFHETLAEFIFPFAISKICTEIYQQWGLPLLYLWLKIKRERRRYSLKCYIIFPSYLMSCRDNYPLLYELLQLTIKSLWKSLFCWSTFRTCVRECQTTGIIGENVISHCQSKENETSVGDSWYNQEQIYMQWKQLDCMTNCRYFCMMQREGERQSLGLSPVKYHGKWPFLRVSVFQVWLVLTRSWVWNNYFYH